MDKKCFNCHYGQCLSIKTNKVSCDFLHKDVENEYAEECENFIPHIYLDSEEDIEIVTEYCVHHKCPYCGNDNEDIIYNADAEGCEVIECEECGKRYSIGWSLY